MTYPQTSRCDDGRLKRDGNMDAIYDGRWWAWRFNRCAICGLLVLPYMVRWIDPAWLRYRVSCLWHWKLLPPWRRHRDRRS